MSFIDYLSRRTHFRSQNNWVWNFWSWTIGQNVQLASTYNWPQLASRTIGPMTSWKNQNYYGYISRPRQCFLFYTFIQNQLSAMLAVLVANCRLCPIVHGQKLQTQLFGDLKCVRHATHFRPTSQGRLTSWLSKNLSLSWRVLEVFD